MGTSVWEPIARVYDPLKAGSIDGTDTIPHDHAVVRAMKAVYKPNKLVVGDPKSTLFVGRLDPLTREETITEIFSRYGKIKRMRLVRDIVTGFSKGYAFVEFKDRRDANDAQRDLNHSVIDNKTILVEPECERTLPGWIPRRLGGGFGGKKESGQLRFGGRERPFKRPLILQNSSERRQEADSRNPHQSKPYFKDRRYDSDKERHFRKGYDSHRKDDYSRDFSRDRHDREKDSRRSRSRLSQTERRIAFCILPPRLDLPAKPNKPVVILESNLPPAPARIRRQADGHLGRGVFTSFENGGCKRKEIM